MSVTGWGFWRHIWKLYSNARCLSGINTCESKGKQAGLGRGIIKQTSLAKPGPAWRAALEYLPHPTGMSWVRSRCLGIYIHIQDCLIQSCDAGWPGKCMTLAEPFSAAEAEPEGANGWMPCRVRVIKLWHMLTSLKKNKTIMKIFIQDINMVSFTSVVGSKHKAWEKKLSPLINKLIRFISLSFVSFMCCPNFPRFVTLWDDAGWQI